MSVRGGAFVAIAAVAGVGYLVLAPRFPKDQSVNIVLGDKATDVTDVTLRYDADHFVAFHFDRTHAPRVVHDAPRLPDGTYTVAIEISAQESTVYRTERRVELRSAGSTSLDITADRKDK